MHIIIDIENSDSLDEIIAVLTLFAEIKNIRTYVGQINVVVERG